MTDFKAWQVKNDFMPDWVGKALLTGAVTKASDMWWVDGLDIKSPNGPVRVMPGDWLVLGHSSVLLHCSDKAFKATFQLGVDP